MASVIPTGRHKRRQSSISTTVAQQVKDEAHQLELKVERLRREMDDVGTTFRDLAHRVRHAQPYNITGRTLEDWAGDILHSFHKAEELFEALRTTGEQMKVNQTTGSAAVPLEKSGTNKSGLFDLVKSMGKSPDSSVRIPSKPSTTTGDPFAQSSMSARGGFSRSVKPTPELKDSRPNFFHENLRGTQVIGAANPELSKKMASLSLAVHAVLESSMRSVRAERAAIYMPSGHDHKDLKAICATGFGPDVILQDLRVLSEQSPQSTALTSGMMIAVHRGLLPATKEAAGEQDVTLLKSLHESLKDTPTKAAGRSPRTTPFSVTPHARSKYWSMLSLPIRSNESAKPLGVLTFFNKNMGKSNFDYEDEHAAYGTGQLLSFMLQRCDDFDLLASCFDPILPVPRIVTSDLMLGGGREATPDQLLPGCRSQLVFRTWNPTGGKEVKIVQADGKSCEKLDERTPLVNVADYILRLQTLWRESVRLNVEFKTTYDKRTQYIANLLQRARVAEYKNAVFADERRELVALDEDQRAHLRRDIMGPTAEEEEAESEAHMIEELTEKAREIEQAASSNASPSMPMSMDPSTSEMHPLQPPGAHGQDDGQFSLFKIHATTADASVQVSLPPPQHAKSVRFESPAKDSEPTIATPTAVKDWAVDFPNGDAAMDASTDPDGLPLGAAAGDPNLSSTDDLDDNPMTSLFSIHSTTIVDESVSVMPQDPQSKTDHFAKQSLSAISNASARSTGSMKSQPLGLMDRESRNTATKQKKIPYRIGNLIGKGAHGKVFLALLEDTGETVAAKQMMFNTEDPNWEKKLKALQREIHVLRNIAHDNVIQYYFADTNLGVKRPPSSPGTASSLFDSDIPTMYVFMEYAAGGSIEAVLKQFGALAERTAALFAAQILIGLAHLHEQGIIHRDVKPANCLLSAFGVVKLADFGTASLASDAGAQAAEIAENPKQDPSLQGTPFYMPPEVIRQEESSPQADIWSFGCTVMQLVTGEMPWKHLGFNAAQTLHAVAVNDTNLAIPEIVGGVPLSGQLVLFLQQCLNKDPSQRPSAKRLLMHPWLQGFDFLMNSSKHDILAAGSLRRDSSGAAILAGTRDPSASPTNANAPPLTADIVTPEDLEIVVKPEVLNNIGAELAASVSTRPLGSSISANPMASLSAFHPSMIPQLEKK